jgi:hypothetical protein
VTAWRYWLYKFGQVFGAGATAFIALWLLTHPSYEPNALIRWFEIAGSLAASIVLACDILDLSPEED